MRIFRNFLIFLVLFIVSAKANDNDILAKVNKYLFSMDTYKANFLQFSDGGDSAEGVFYISRPDKLKFDYINPFRSSLITNGKTTYYYDIEMDELTTIPSKKTPLLFLLKKKNSIKELGFDVVSIEKKDGKVYVTTKNKEINELEDKNVIFVFDNNIEKLIGISIEDDMKNRIYVNFSNIELNGKIDKSVFDVNFKKMKRKGKF